MEISDVKTILGWTNITKHDDYLTEVVPLFLEIAESKTNNTFKVGKEPAGVKLFVAKACQFNIKEVGLKGRTMGDVSYSYETDLPDSITKLLRPYKKVKLHG